MKVKKLLSALAVCLSVSAMFYSCGPAGPKEAENKSKVQANVPNDWENPEMIGENKHGSYRPYL